MIRRPLHQKRSLPFRACIVDLGCVTRATTWDGKRIKTPATTLSLSLCLDPQYQAYLKKPRRLADFSFPARLPRPQDRGLSHYIPSCETDEHPWLWQAVRPNLQVVQRAHAHESHRVDWTALRIEPL